MCVCVCVCVFDSVCVVDSLCVFDRVHVRVCVCVCLTLCVFAGRLLSVYVRGCLDRNVNVNNVSQMLHWTELGTS